MKIAKFTNMALPARGLGEELTTAGLVTKRIHVPWAGLILLYNLSNGKGTLDLVRGMLRACLGQVHLTAVARELARYKLDLVGVQGVRWEEESTVRIGDYNF